MAKFSRRERRERQRERAREREALQSKAASAPQEPASPDVGPSAATAMWAGAGLGFCSVLVAMMASEAPVFRLLVVMTGATALCFAYALMRAHTFRGRPLLRRLGVLAVLAVSAYATYPPLMAQYEREQTRKFSVKPNFIGAEILGSSAGRVRLDESTLKLNVNNVTLAVRPDLPKTTIDYIQFGVGVSNWRYVHPGVGTPYDWHIRARGEKLPVGKVVVGGDGGISMPGFETYIDVSGVDGYDFAHSRLVLEVGFTADGAKAQTLAWSTSDWKSFTLRTSMSQR